MASPETYTTTATELIYTAIIEASIKAELGAVPILGPLCRFHDLSGEASGAWSVPQWPNIDASVTAPLGEQVDLTMTALNPTQVTVTAAEAGIATDVSDRLFNRNVLQEGLAAEVGQYLGRAVARQVDTDIAALFSSFSTSVGVGTSDLAEIDFLSAIYSLENADAAGPIVSCFHPLQVHDLRKAMTLTATAGTSLATATIKASMDLNAIGAMQGVSSGLWTTLYNVPVYISSKVPLSVDDYHGAMFIGGSAIGIAVKYMGRVEFQRNASLRATEVVVVSDYGVAELVDKEGVRIISDSTN